MVRAASTRLPASTHWTLRSLQSALYSATTRTTTPTTLTRRAVYSTHEHTSASVKNKTSSKETQATSKHLRKAPPVQTHHFHGAPTERVYRTRQQSTSGLLKNNTSGSQIQTQNHTSGERPFKPGYKNAEKHADRNSYDAGSGSVRTTQPNSGDSSRKEAIENIFPTNFRIVPNTERIESLDKEGVQRLFTLRYGSQTIGTEAFNLKSARMKFVEPPVPNVPRFVEQAIEEYNLALAAYRQNQLDLEKIAGESHMDTSPATTTSIATLPMPKPSPFIRQYSLRNLRQYPATVDSPHPPYRVVYVVPKKTVSKLAIHRNLCRKKLSAAVETVFREHARSGFEYMFFAKQQCVTMTQKELEEMLIKTLKNPNLYPDTASYRNKDRPSLAAKPRETSTLPQSPPSVLQDSSVRVEPTIKVRWKNNRPPLKWNWWKHALPHPLGRTHQADEYLDMHTQKSTGEIALDISMYQEKTKPAKSKK